MIPDDVRELFDRLLRIDMAGVIGGHPKKVRVNHKAKSWLDSLPKLPEPPWEDAPELADYHGWTIYGHGVWWGWRGKGEAPEITNQTEMGMEIMLWDMLGDSGLFLSLGLDPRSAPFQRRPEAK